MATTPDKNDSTDVEADKSRFQKFFFGTQENGILCTITLDSTPGPAKIDTKKTALVIVDMQNNFLDDEFRPEYKMSRWRDLASNALLQHAIPAARKLGIQIIWLNWGFMEEEANNIPPAQAMEFMFGNLRISREAKTVGGQLKNELAKQQADDEVSGPTLSKSQKIHMPDLDNVPGESREEIELADGSIFEPGRVMSKGTWNASLYKPFNDAYEESKKTSCPDILIDRSRNCGLYAEGNSPLAARELASALEGHPATMAQAASRRFHNSWTIKEVLKNCRDHPEPPVKAIWDITFRLLGKKERDILGMTIFLPVEYIYTSFFQPAYIKALTPGYPEVCFEPTDCEELKKVALLGLLQWPDNAPVFSICRYVQTAFKEFMDPRERQEGFGNAVALAFAAYPGNIPDFPFGDTEFSLVNTWSGPCFTHLSTIMRLKDYFFEERKADVKSSTGSLFCELLNLALGYLLKKNAYDDMLALAEDNTTAISTVKFSSHWTRVSTEGGLALYKGQALVRTGRIEEGVRQLRIAQDIFFTAEPYCRFADAASCAECLAEAMLSIGNFAKAMQHYEQARSWRAQEHIGTNNGEIPKETPLSFEWSRHICLFELKRGNDAEQMEVIWDLGTYINPKSLLGLPKHIQRSIVPYAKFALGKMYQSLGLLSSAELFFKQAMKNCFVKARPANAEKYGFLDLEQLLASCLYRMACIALDQGNELTALDHLHNARDITRQYKASMPVEHARVLLKLAELKEMDDDLEDSDDSEKLHHKDLCEEAVKLLQSRFLDAKDVNSLKTYDDAVFIWWR
ncbi:NB-ARC and TPR domain-containing protein [Penicillium malachiteum]|uniref:NB-ARC and TPR domain-containing protein n=1 Tax=Penicillium malachiteum TaxID=1324776 RepID=A0AAD6MZ96_9EURO|nr:NB-ARC and TPR domain-containing protein [Penicillium malachiteum]